MAQNGSPTEERLKLKQQLDAHYPLLSKMVTAICFSLWYECNPAEQADLCQEIYVKLGENDCEQLSTFRGDCEFSTFLYGATRLHIRNKRRERKWCVTWEDWMLEIPSQEPDAEARLIAEDQSQVFEAAVATLSTDEALLLERKCEGLNAKQIAELIGVKPQTVRKKLCELRKKLRNAVIEGGGGVSNGLEKI